jgi:hypothetical protein
LAGFDRNGLLGCPMTFYTHKRLTVAKKLLRIFTTFLLWWPDIIVMICRPIGKMLFKPMQGILLK